MKKDETNDGAVDESAVCDMEKALGELQGKHGEKKVRRFTVDSEDVQYDIILKRPDLTVVKRFYDEITESYGDAVHQLLVECAAVPDVEGLTPLVEEYPGILIPVGAQLLRWSGVSKADKSRRVKNA